MGVVPETLEGGMTLSPRVAGAVGRAGEVVIRELAQPTSRCQRRIRHGQSHRPADGNDDPRVTEILTSIKRTRPLYLAR